MDKKYIIEKIYTENLKEVWKLSIKQNKKIIDSKIHKNLNSIMKKIKENIDNYK